MCRSKLISSVVVLHYSGKRFNFHDVLICAYDQTLLKTQMKVALDRVAVDSTITRQQTEREPPCSISYPMA
jgi:hypothetical protein